MIETFDLVFQKQHNFKIDKKSKQIMNQLKSLWLNKKL